MTNDFKKWLCELAGFDEFCSEIWESIYENDKLAILIKAMWAINREEENKHFFMTVEICVGGIKVDTPDNYKLFEFRRYKKYNSEQSALEAALQYIYNSRKDKI